MPSSTTTSLVLATAFCGTMAGSALADNQNFNENLCVSDITQSDGLTPLELIDGFNILSAGTGKPTFLFFEPSTRLHYTATPPMYGYPSLFRMHDDEKWCYVEQETFDNANKVLVDPNRPTFEA